MKKVLSLILSVVMLISAVDITASADGYFNYSGGVIYTDNDFYDLLAMSRASAQEVDLTSTAKFKDQVFAQNVSSLRGVYFAGYEINLKRKDTVSFKFEVSQKFISNCVAVYIFNDDHEFLYEDGFSRTQRTAKTSFSDSITLSKGKYYLFYVTKTKKNVDFDLTISAPKHKENKPKFTLTAKDDGKVKISWKEVPGATKYRVYKYVNGQFKEVKTTTKLSYTVKNLVKNNKYSYLVTAYVNGKWTSKSVNDVKSVTAK